MNTSSPLSSFSSPSPSSSPFLPFFKRLGPKAEPSFRTLLRHLRLADGFVLEIVELPGQAFVQSLLLKLQDQLPLASLPLSLEPSSIFQSLLQPPPHEEADASALWGTRQAAWPPLLRWLNERRNHVIRSHPRPLLLIGGFFLNELLQSLAPDLWSVRSGIHRFPDPPPEAQTPFAGNKPPLFFLKESSSVARLKRFLEDMPSSPSRLEPSRRASFLLRLGKAYCLQDRHKEAQEYAYQALHLFEQNADKLGLAGAFSDLGAISQRRGDLDGSLSFYEKAFALKTKLGLNHEASVDLFYLARLHEAKGDLEQALLLHQRSYDIKESVGDRQGMAISLQMLGSVSEKQGLYDQSLRFYHQSRALKEQIDDPQGIAISLHSIGHIYERRGDYEQALELYDDSCLLKEQIRDQVGLAISLFQKGFVYQEIADYERALAMYRDALSLRLELSDSWGTCQILSQMASLYRLRGETNLALSFAHQARECLRSKRLALSPPKEPAFMEDLLLLHLSNLRFGDKERFAGQDPRIFGRAFHRALEVSIKTLIQELQLTKATPRIKFVLLSGDITQSAKPAEFQHAHDFLQSLAGELGIEHQRFIFVPGNHDISWPLCKKVVAEQEEEGFGEEELRRRIDRVKLQRYNEFLQNFYGVPRLSDLPGLSSLGHHAWIHRFESFSLSIAALNSCENESHRPQDHAAFLSSSQMQNLLACWTSEPHASCLKLAVLHHDPAPTPPDRPAFSGLEALQKIVRDARVHAVLHASASPTPKTEPPFWSWSGESRAPVLSASYPLEDAAPEPPVPPCQLLFFRTTGSSPRLEACQLAPEGSFLLEDGKLQGQFRSLPPKYNAPLVFPAQFNKNSLASGPSRTSSQEETASKSEDGGFLRAYRQRMRSLFTTWDLRPVGVPQGGSFSRPIHADLDAMYLPLRFGRGFDPKNVDQGSVLDANALLARFQTSTAAPDPALSTRPESYGPQPLLLRGPAGTGKTTWMRYTFRKLLEDARVFPLLVTLRDLARLWKETPQKEAPCSLEHFLEAWFAEHMGKGWEGRLSVLLKNSPKLRPILLVDGWDELGPFGKQFRQDLEDFRRTHSHVLVVVSSRPYGEERPQHSDGFEELDIQPLSPQEIDTFTQNFFSCCYEGDAIEQKREVERFRQALRRSPESAALAQTTLLLSMMLMISRSDRLPDKRHLLYGKCIDNLLTALPDLRSELGVQEMPGHWCPSDGEERKRVVAALAHSLRVTSADSTAPPKVFTSNRSALVATWEEMAASLPNAWDEKRKMGFLSWLAGPAGLLTDRADGTLVFAHLSFQEYLTAWHLNANLVEENRITDVFLGLINEPIWRETLSLWAALLHSSNPRRLHPIVRALLGLKQDGGMIFVGLLMADGLGPDDVFLLWKEEVVSLLRARWPWEMELCLQAWNASRQDERKSSLRVLISECVSDVGWAAWIRFGQFWNALRAEDTEPLPKPSRSLAANTAVQSVEIGFDPFSSPQAFAGGRVLCGGFPLWPGKTVGLLHLWPNPRRIPAYQLQQASAIGASQQTLLLLGEGFVKREARSRNTVANLLSYEISEGISQTPQVVREIAQQVIYGWFRDWCYEWQEDATASEQMLRWIFFQIKGSVGEWVRTWQEFSMREWPRRRVLRWQSEIAKGRTASWIRRYPHRLWNTDEFIKWEGRHDFAATLATSWGVYASRGIASLLKKSPHPEERLLAHASELSLSPQKSPHRFNAALKDARDCDPMWLALARHISRRSTQEDRALLSDLARHPEKREPPLSWGLKYIVRGDLLLADGSEMTLDELCTPIGLPPLPYLEEMPDELEPEEESSQEEQN